MHHIGLKSSFKAPMFERFHSTANWEGYLILQKQTLGRCFPLEFGNFCHWCVRICNYSSVPFHPPQLSLAMFPLIRKLSYNLRLELEHKAVIAPFCLCPYRIHVVKLRRLLCLDLSTFQKQVFTWASFCFAWFESAVPPVQMLWELVVGSPGFRKFKPPILLIVLKPLRIFSHHLTFSFLLHPWPVSLSH